MANFFADYFAESVVLAVLLLAMFPMVESKIAIPFALSTLLWGKNTLSPASAYFVALFGSMVPVVFIMLAVRFIKSRTSGFVQERFLQKFLDRHKKSLEKLKSENTTLRKCVSLAAFVAVPLPLTGVWTGAIVAGMANLKFWQGFLSVLMGDMISCGIVLLLCLVFENSAFYIFLISIILIAVLLLVDLSTRIIKRKVCNCKK